MKKITDHFIKQNATLTDAVKMLEILKSDAILFLVDNEDKLLGTLTDGDIRRAILSGKSLHSKVYECIQKEPVFIEKGNIKIEEIIFWRENNYKIIPIVNKEMRIIEILNFREKRSIVPVDCVIMAGGKGERLKPLTDQIPKPLLPVGEKPIIEHLIDHCAHYGIENIFITTNYLSNQLDTFLETKKSNSLMLRSIHETKFMGTIGSVKLIENFQHNDIFVSNSDLLTNVDIEQFYLCFKRSGADCTILSIPYQIDIPFGVIKVENELLTSIDEKPTYTYNTNGGMYIVKKELLSLIPDDDKFSAVDFLELLMKHNKKITLYNHYGYWLDIGNHNDYLRAQKDVQHIYSHFKT
jgi:dTDP-glucose pyrophosphorylase